MTQIIELKLSSGKSIFVEAETPATGGMREMSGGAGERISKRFDEIAEIIGAVAENLEEHLAALKKGPKQVQVEIHAVIKAGGLLFFAQGSAEGGIKIKLTWDR